MVDIIDKLMQIKSMVYRGDYFVISRPRQYGKTTTMYMLEQDLKYEYLVLSISFEGLGDTIFENESEFSLSFIKNLSKAAKFQDIEISKYISELKDGINNFESLSEAITELIEESRKDIILFIDEVDKSSNNQLFMSFLGMLRNKFLLRQQGKDRAFHSVILAGVYDIKNLKLKIRQDDEKKYNSPWNIAVNFNVDMKFNAEEITTMLNEYSKDKKVYIDIKKTAEVIHFYTNGYLFLVSRLCQIIDEDIMSANETAWNLEYINKSVKEILQENNTLFDDLVKNIENNNEFREYIFDLIINGNDKTFNIDNPIINLGVVFGYFENINGRVTISNRIFQERLYNYFSSKLENKTDMSAYNFKENFITEKGLKQLKDYLDIQGLDNGYLVIYNFNKDKAYKAETVKYEGKEIFVIYV